MVASVRVEELPTSSVRVEELPTSSVRVEELPTSRCVYCRLKLWLLWRKCAVFFLRHFDKR